MVRKSVVLLALPALLLLLFGCTLPGASPPSDPLEALNPQIHSASSQQDAAALSAQVANLSASAVCPSQSMCDVNAPSWYSPP